MLRISIYPFLIELPENKRRKLLDLIENVQPGASRIQQFSWLFRKAAKENITECFVNHLAKIDLLASHTQGSNLLGRVGEESRPQSKLQEFMVLL